MGKNEIKYRGRLLVEVICAKDLIAADRDGSSDPYVQLTLGDNEEKTEVLEKKLNPEWDAKFCFTPSQGDFGEPLKVVVYDKDTVGSDKLGEVEIPLVATKDYVDQWYPLKGDGKLHLRTHFITIEHLVEYYNEEVAAKKTALEELEEVRAKLAEKEKEAAEAAKELEELRPKAAALEAENNELKGSAGHKVEEGLKGAAGKIGGFFKK